MISVRGYKDKDREAVERICIETGPAAALSDARERELLLYMYCRYYTSKSKESCFVGADENDKPVGYIFCAPDRKKYKREYLRDEVAAIRKLSFSRSLLALGEIFISIPFEKKYPAHLHIDLSDGYRSQGLGSRLVDALCGKLNNDGVKGVMLIVGGDNKGAIRFYQKNGFQILLGTKFFKVMGRIL